MKIKVKDVMTKKVKSIPPELDAKSAFKMLLKAGMSGLPVVDSEGRLVGVFTEKEILKAILPVYIKDVGDFVYGDDSKIELKKIARLAELSVRDIMRTEVPTLEEESSLAEASKIMLTKSERRIIITRGNKAVGVITRSDVVSALAKEAGLVL